MTVFTDREAAVEELEFLVAETGAAHVIVPERDGRANRWQVVPAVEAGDRTPLVICTPPWRPEVA
ncbi:MAG: hypothetical protein Q7Q73_09310 [Verrucomicrobiota bacterium JB024]|nr:hypothetical protein [Verrucomicrobiota bacterium JB024]